ncbi:MAG: carboxyl transferase domain-containing protein [Chitinophagales bacterium]|nr:methylcrotonoyl-CoA carboxylase [Chitinophagales bacterium]MDW8273445.1 carboxyl transferase domain-containing protein [Chitinophagales bacterium]
MGVLSTAVNIHSDAFKSNYQAMLHLIDKLEEFKKEALYQGKERHLKKARSEGKLTARERIELLLDENSPFLELLPFAGISGKNSEGGTTTVGGIGLVCGRLCMIISNVGTNKGGAINLPTLQKSLRLGEIAMENELPVINLVESAGADLPEQAKIFNYGGATFRDITRRSKEGIPSISVVFGNCTAGGAYVPGMSDYAIFVKNKAKVFLAGPPLVKMATNEIVDDESLGGAEMHSRISGVSDYLAEDEADAIRIARSIIQHLRPSRMQNIPSYRIKSPLYPADELLGIVPADIKKPFDAREVIARIVDGSEFDEFKPDWGSTLVTGWAHIHGYPVGIIANNGVLFSESANKGAHFIQLCNRNLTPILFLQNITGFMVGRQYEEGGIIKNGAKMINAVSNSEVPAITIMMGASYGAGNYAMCGRAYQPRFLFSYPNSKIAVMGPEQLSGVMEIIQRQAVEKMGGTYDEEQAKMFRNHLMGEVEKQSNAFYASAQLWDDGILDPRETRNYLGFCLAVVNNKPLRSSNKYGVFRM